MNSPQKPEKNGNIVKGPWPDIIKPNVNKELKYADDLAEAIMVQMLAILKENDFDNSKESFNGDIGFTMETIRGVIYRSMGYDHPLHVFMGDALNITETQKGDYVQYTTSLNVDMINEMNEYISIIPDDDGPEHA